MVEGSGGKAGTAHLWLAGTNLVLFTVLFSLLFLGVLDRPQLGGGKGHGSVKEGMDDAREAMVTVDGDGSVAEGGEAGEGLEAGVGRQGLVVGDILLGRCRLSPVPSLNPHNGWTHAALYVGGGKLLVASNPASGVIETEIEAWSYPDMTWVAYLRVENADDAVRSEAVAYARRKRGQPYDINWFKRQEDGGSWYCSELVWAAYLHASGGSIDLSRGPAWFGISPDDIFMNEHSTVVGGHYEKKPDTIFSLVMKAMALCMLASGPGALAPHPFSFLFARRWRRIA